MGKEMKMRLYEFIIKYLSGFYITVKKEEFISQQEYRVSWYSLLWCLRLFIAFTVHELHLRVAIILKFALLFKPTFGMWRVLLQEFLRNWPESLFRSDCKKQYWSKSKLIVSSSSLVAPFRLEWGWGGLQTPGILSQWIQLTLLSGTVLWNPIHTGWKLNCSES